MSSIKIKVYGTEYSVTFEEVQYQTGVPGIQAMTGFYPFAVLSFNASDECGYTIHPDKGCIWLKDWSENAEIAKFLLDNEYVSLTGKQIPAGFVVYKEAKVESKLLDILQDRNLL
jgi:hypothetical protein